MVEASPFASLEHATSFARDLWFNTLPIQSWLDTFSAHRHIGDAITIAHGDIRMGLLQFVTKYCKKFGFGFVTSTNLFLSQQILEEVQVLLLHACLCGDPVSWSPFSLYPKFGGSTLTLNPVIHLRLEKMPRVGRFTKKARVDTACQQPQRADCPILPPSGSGALASSSLRPFRPPRSEPLPAPQACTNDVQNSEPEAEDLDPEADEVDSFDQHVDNLFAVSDAQKRKGCKTIEFWDVKTIGIREFI
ncbi:hypothetical protein Ahy_B09g095995 isoform A [Arachis hypogaea]|uniref:Oxo-4-hydroxy-4-carboxy-5-ureidoimidazoline decarboxylase domain-containing protein n=1 Tax=Arachis hypogaea TaxID=3818 RepID=A0A444XHQ7_ARAHY|nr:hypothetical protein Ahy_B09g095995 isoform A [Arachis hypogaea]